jgi:hypothetical protein
MGTKGVIDIFYQKVMVIASPSFPISFQFRKEEERERSAVLFFELKKRERTPPTPIQKSAQTKGLGLIQKDGFTLTPEGRSENHLFVFRC